MWLLKSIHTSDQKQSSQWEAAFSPSELRQHHWLGCNLWKNDIYRWAPLQLDFLRLTFGSQASSDLTLWNMSSSYNCVEFFMLWKEMKISKLISTFWSVSNIIFISQRDHKWELYLHHFTSSSDPSTLMSALLSLVCDLSSSIIVTHTCAWIYMNVCICIWNLLGLFRISCMYMCWRIGTWVWIIY